MKAYVLKAIGNFGMEEVPKPVPGEKEVLIAVKAAGICGSDIPRIYYTGTYSYPLIPGHEFSGVVVETGKEVDEAWFGKRVGIFPLIPCEKCRPCLDKQYELCRNYSYLGSRTAGGFAEYVKVPEWNLIELPDTITFEQAAMLEPMAVAVHAMRRVDIAEGSTVAVCGLGTIGLLLFSLLMEKMEKEDMGIKRILLIGNKSSQGAFAMKLGLEEEYFCNSKETDADKWLSDKTNGQGADIFFDCTGRNETVSLAIRSTAPSGKVILVGNPAGDMTFSRQEYWKILRNQLTVTGTWNSSFTHDSSDDWHYCLQAITQGNVKPEMLITQKLSFDKLTEGTELMRDKKMPYVKVMVEMQGTDG